MRWKPVVLLLTLAISESQAAELTCPKQWTFAGTARPLTWAEFWAGDQSMDPRNAEFRKRLHHHFSDVWNMDKEARPAFIWCRYGSFTENHNLILSLPDDITTCRRDGFDHGSFNSVTVIRCESASSPDGATVHAVETATSATEVEGFRLRETAEEVKSTAAGLHAVINFTDGAEQTFDVIVPANSTHLTVTMSHSSGLAREITLFGPNPDWVRFDFYRKIASRFGVWHSIGPLPNTFGWRGDDGIRVEWWQGDRDRKIPESMHLIDMTDPESQRLHPTE